MKRKTTNLVLFSALLISTISISSYILGCYTIKHELFPYSVYREWKDSRYQPNKKIRSSKELFELIKGGGYVIQFRHTHRDRLSIPVIPPSVDLNYSCVDGASLTSLGKEQARWIKLNMKKHKIPLGEIYSSPACRLRQMCQIIFSDQNVIYSQLLFYDRILVEEQVSKKKNYIRKLLSEPISDCCNRYIMGHQGTYHPIGYNLPEGHAFVYKPLGNNSFEFLGTIDLVTWLP
jgi:hypothetical protein